MQPKIAHKVLTMSLLKRLLKPNKRDANSKAVRATLREQDEAKLCALVVSSKDAKLREEAVAKLPMGEELINLATGDHSAKIKRLARQQVGVWLEKDEGLVDQLKTQFANKHTELLNVVSSSSKAVDKVFAGITDEQVLMDIACHGATSSIRQQAAESIHSRECLDALFDAVKSKDKNVTQIVKAKLDAFKLAEAALVEKQQEAQSICAGLEALKKRRVDDYFSQRYAELQAKWSTLKEEEKVSAAQRFQEADTSCQQLLEQEEQRKQADREQQMALEQARLAVETLQHQFASLLAELYQSEQVESEAVRAQLTEYAAQLKALQQVNPHLGEPSKTCYALRESAENLLLDIEKNGSLSQLLKSLETADDTNGGDICRRINRLLRHKKQLAGETPAILEKATQAVRAWSEAKKQQIEDEEKLLKSLNELQRKATWAIDKGRLRQARGIYRELCEKREKLDDLPAHLVRRLEELDEAMEKLGDWYEFAVQPKKRALVEQMEALVESELHPNDLSDKIKALQDEWKALSKGGISQDEDLWQRFQTAADKAFEPCRQYFDEQAQVREQNALKRQEILSQLQTYYEAYSWETPVWKDVDKIIATAYDNWKSFWPVPRKDNKALQAKFDDIMEKIQAKLSEARAVNHQAKENLIKQAEALLGRDDTAIMVEEAKRLQSMWKALGGTGGRGRNGDQKLWQQFRRACDQIFERKQQEHQAVQDKFNSERERANASLKQLDEILSQNGQHFLEARKTVADVQQAFLEVGELPEKETHRLHSEFNKKIEQIDNKAKKLRNAQLQDSWNVVYQVANELRAYEEAVLSRSADPEALDELKNVIAELENWPPGTRKLIDQRLENAENREIDTSNSEKALRLLCIRKEISEGKASPEADKSLRMEYQVEQLQQGFGNKDAAQEPEDALALEWLAVPGLEESRYEELFKRFSQG